MDSFASEIIQSDKASMVRKRWGYKPTRTPLLTPEEEVRQLIMSANRLQDIWDFFNHRLRTGTELSLLCFSVLDDGEDSIRMRFHYPCPPRPDVQSNESQSNESGTRTERQPYQQPIIFLSEKGNHLVQAYKRKDTTFCGTLKELGDEVLTSVGMDAAANSCLNIFSIPLIAGDRAIAMVTLGFSEIDAFSQAKLSYVYTIRDQIAQLVWNLILQERMKNQAQVDNLTGLLSHSSFQRVLELELEKADQQNSAVTVMILDINNIQEINQSYGHHAGDEAICLLASTVRRLIRGVDSVARYGADEVVVVLPETDIETADQIADRFIQGVRERKSGMKNGLKDISVSIGYATYPADTSARDSLVNLAEQALQLAKFKGAKTGESTRIASNEVDQLNDKTVLEVFASHIAKKYNHHGPSIFQELVKRVESREEGVQNPESLMFETIGSLAGALDAKDKYTRGHSQAVSNYAVAMAHALKMSPEEVEQIRLAAFLHDIGKIGIPESILCKAGPLNENEWEIMKQHPVIGAKQILAPVSALKDVIPMVEYHHENWDGTGYPEGLKGEDIPLGARIVAIVDAFHGLTSDRSYRKALAVSQAKSIMEADCGIKWDPNLLQVFFSILNIATPKS